MPLTAGEVMDRAAVLLNDSNKTLYGYTVQIPFLKTVLRTFEGELQQLQITAKVYKWSGEIAIPASSVAIPSLSIPADMLLPIELHEKGSGETADFFAPINKCSPLPLRTMYAVLADWDWIEDAVSFVGATADRVIKIYYQKSNTQITDQTSNIFTADCLELIATWLARDLALIIGGSEKRAGNLESLREGLFETYVGPKLGQRQATAVRRIPYGGLGWTSKNRTF